jgi:hypothetical protein
MRVTIGERHIYIGRDFPDLKYGKTGVAFYNPGFDDPQSIEYGALSFYPDGDAIGYYVEATELQREE